MADPRALSQQAEDEHALYCAGRLGGHILTATGWLAAPHPEAEIRLEDLMPAPRQKSQRAGLFGFLKRHA
ncbi:hypothetical protein [Deinococcus sonorensis]|uniref:Uncharacterized protein n=2 Tax=Deinococcus sonorensis TaxID=309891 RepID=A0AAU7U9A7_9DEIO